MAMQLGSRLVATIDRAATHQRWSLRGVPLYFLCFYPVSFVEHVRGIHPRIQIPLEPVPSKCNVVGDINPLHAKIVNALLVLVNF